LAARDHERLSLLAPSARSRPGGEVPLATTAQRLGLALLLVVQFLLRDVTDRGLG
jgi:hypothetical protein